MSFLSNLSVNEAIAYFALLVVTVYILLSNYNKGPVILWSPLTIIVLIFAYYCLIGPYQAITTGKTYDRLVNMRQFYSSAFLGALVSVLSCIAGFHLNNTKGKQISFKFPLQALSDYGRWLCVVGFILFTISTGGNIAKLINPLDAQSVEQGGGTLANYFGLSLNFLIPGVTFLFTYYIKTRRGLGPLLVAGVIALGLFTTMGFRFRIVLLVLSCVMCYYLISNKRPNIIFVVLGIYLFISLMGVIDKTRQYGAGLDLQQLSNNRRNQSNYESGLNETKIFQTSGAIIDFVPERIPYVGLTPIWSTLLFPIPRAIYTSKNSADYVITAISAIYGKKNSRGAAFLMYAEHYLAFGWIGIVIAGMVLGWFLKKLWVWFIANSTNPLIVVIYASTVSFLYVIISRGYLPQATMIFFFTVFPAYVGFWLIKRKSSVVVLKPAINRAP